MNEPMNEVASIRFMIAERPEEPLEATSFEIPRADAAALLTCLGLESACECCVFGAVAARAVAPLCRRRLWPERAPRPALRSWVEKLLALAEHAGDGTILFS